MTLTRSLLRPALVTALLLLVPLVGMQFSKEVVWSTSDFVIAGLLLFSTGFAYELIAQKGGSLAYRAASAAALLAGLLLVWVNLAVGLIGSEDNPANLLYGGVLIVAILGAIFTGLRASGMVRVLLTTALTQFLVPIVALLIWKPEFTAGVVKVFGANMFFVLLWLGAAWLFHRASLTGTSR